MLVEQGFEAVQQMPTSEMIVTMYDFQISGQFHILFRSAYVQNCRAITAVVNVRIKMIPARLRRR
jgi:hypothetical protein